MAIKSIEQMVAEARSELTNHSCDEAKRRVDAGTAMFVDIRDVRELQREGVIPGAMHAPRGMLEFWVAPDSPYFKPIFAEDIEFVLY
jgi:rhodanese-related sulfurtransferase